mmetsp:Transcript_11778/g.29026  ORF Transcript_11778/g.29026 Transcript_11778/m.29026 type:complete len:1553 (-) Transcript_11778:344-5002(-)
MPTREDGKAPLVVMKQRTIHDVEMEDVTIHVNKPTTTDSSLREVRNQIVKDLLDPDKAIDFTIAEELDDIQIAQFIREVKKEDLPVILKKFRRVAAGREEKLKSNLTFQHISYNKGGETYLSGVSGFVRKNTMTCVIGAPDSGITTLLKTLAGRASAEAKTSGSIFLEGSPIDDGFGQHVGYIPKDDLNYATLTVRETLRMSARMRVGEFADVLRKIIVEIVMKFFGLDGHISSTIVGDETIRGISGGQKRRLSVACEIVANHSIILADLLTNGLDSKTSFDLVQLMQTVCHNKEENMAMMISLVQPAPELFNLFDNLLVMSKGRSIYFGPVRHNDRYPVIEFLDSLGFKCPPSKSIPDFLAEISYNPVRFHSSRLPKEVLNMEEGYEGKAKGEGKLKREEKHKVAVEIKVDEVEEEAMAAQRKLYTGKLSSQFFESNPEHPPRVKTLKEALENRMKKGEYKIPMHAELNGQSGRTSYVALQKESMKAIESQTIKTSSTNAGEHKGLFRESTHDDINGIRLRRQPSTKSEKGTEVFTTQENEREVGFAYLLQAYKASSLYDALGRTLWKEFEPNMPWESNGPKVDKFSTSLWYQTFECLKREWIVKTRDRTTLIGNLFEEILVSFILGTVFLNIGDEQKDADGRAGLLFTLLLHFAMGVSAQIPSLMEKKRIYYAQESAGYYHGYAFFLAQQLIYIPFLLYKLLIFLLITYGLVGLEGGVGGVQFWNMFVTLFFVTLISLTWALFLCGIAPNTTAAVALFPVTVILKMLVSGYMISPDDIPNYWKWLTVISYVTYGFRALAINEFYDLTLTCASDELQPDKDVDNFNTAVPNGFAGNQACPFTTGRQFLARYDMEDFGKSEIDTSILYLFVIFVIYHFLALYSLVLRPHELGDQEEVPKFDIVEVGEEAEQEEGVDKEKGYDSKRASSVIEWYHLNYEVKNRKNPDETILLLGDVMGYARPGDMIALMGPSGAGKSTLLDVIAGRKTSGWITGKRHINGKDIDEFLPRIAGYVEQFDTHVERATVYESVMFSAKLRLECNDEEAHAETEKAMRAVRIWHVKDRLIGNIESGGISPELRKKLAIAVELVANPTILFLDEPTTGLDSVSAMAVVETIAHLSRKGLAVVCTIHQPSSELFSRFQRILILQPVKGKGGRVSYFGDVSNVLSYCKRNKLGEMTIGRNIADFALEALGSTRQDGREPADVFMETKEFKEAQNLLEKGVFESTEGVQPPEFENVFAAGILRQFSVVMQRSYLDVIRDVDTLRAQIGSVFIMGFVIGTLYFQMGTDQEGAAQRISMNFLAIIFILYSASYKIQLLIDARASIFREKASNTYQPWIYYLSQMFCDFIVFVPRALIFGVMVYFLAGMNLDDNGVRFGYFILMLIVVFWMGLGIGETMAIFSPNEKLAQTYFSVVLTIFTLFCGFLIKVDNIPPWWIWLYYGNIIRYTLNFFNVNELAGLNFNCPLNRGAVPVPVGETFVDENGDTQPCSFPAQKDNEFCFRFACPFTEGDDILEEFGMDEGLPLYIGVTFAIAITIRLLNVYGFTHVNWVDK